MNLYKFVGTIEIGENEYDTYYQLIVANNKKKARENFNNLIGGLGIKIFEVSITCEEIKEIDDHKIIVEDSMEECQYCNDFNNEKEEMIIDKIYIQTAGHFWYQCPIKYCPNCGKILNKYKNNKED